MQVTLATTEGLGRRLTVTVPSETIEKHYKTKINEVAKTAKMDGFRQGKVPARVIEERYGDSVRHEAVDKAIRETLHKALMQEKLVPAGMPVINDIKAEKGQDLIYVADFEIYPEITVNDLAGDAIEQLEASVTEDNLATALDRLRDQHADWHEVERASEQGDRVTVDFEGFLNGETFEGGSATQVPLVLGSKTMIPGFEEGLVGKKAGDSVDLNVTFPEVYHAEKLAGKTVTFKSKIHKVEMPQKPELDEKFAEKFSIKEGGVDALKKDIRKHMDREVGHLVKMRNKERVFNRLLEKNPIPVPRSLIDQEMMAMHHASHHHQGEKCDHKELTEAEKAELAPAAERRVRLALLVNELIKTFSLKADPERAKTVVAEMSGGYDNPDEFVRWYFSDRNRVAQVESMVLEDQVVEALLKTASVQPKTMSYEELVKS